MNTTTSRPTLEKISQRAAKNAIRRDEDFQGAQNEAYETALDHGYSEDEASECAKEAGVWHGEYLDAEQIDEPRGSFRYYENDPGYRSCDCEDYPCCGH